MLYIVVALKSEAQAFVDRYRLQKSKLQNLVFYENEDIRLIISGIGVKSAREATQTLINQFDITDEDRYLNIGICGASTSYKIGQSLEIGSINYEDITYSFDIIKNEITCLDAAAKETKHKIVDMESYGFYDAIIHNPAIKNFSIIKVVSDHFEPQKVTKKNAKMLVFNALENI